MSVKEYNIKIIITDAMTGKVIVTLPYNKLSIETIKQVVNDILEEDLINQNGLIIKYGIEP